MPWAAAAAVGGAVLQSRSASSAARRQQSAADAATQEQRRQYDQTREDQAPYRQAGTDALGRMVQLGSEYGQPVSPESVMAEPGYEFGRREGERNIESSAAARGGLYSGNALRALTRYNSNYAGTRYNDAFNRQQTAQGNNWNRFAGLAGIGQTATQQTNAAGQNAANNIGNIGLGNADAQGAARIAQGNIWGNALNQAGSAYGRYASRQQPPSGNTGNTGAWNGPNFDPDTGATLFADGGPVRTPVVGTRTPLPQGSTGGMSREDILRALDAARVPQPVAAPQPGGLRHMQIELAERKALGYMGGGEVDGPGGPRDDAITARLSDGEHVVDAAAVDAMGGGDNARGQRRMNALRAVMKVL